MLEAGHDGSGDPAGICQYEGEKEVSVDLVPETAHFSTKRLRSK